MASPFPFVYSQVVNVQKFLGLTKANSLSARNFKIFCIVDQED